MAGCWGAPTGPNPADGAACTQEPAFAEECEALYTAEQHEKLLDKFIGSLDTVLASSASDAGERRRRPAAAAGGHRGRPACSFAAPAVDMRMPARCRQTPRAAAVHSVRLLGGAALPLKRCLLNRRLPCCPPCPVKQTWSAA